MPSSIWRKDQQVDEAERLRVIFSLLDTLSLLLSLIIDTSFMNQYTKQIQDVNYPVNVIIIIKCLTLKLSSLL